MADSDHSTTMPPVTNGTTANALNRLPDADPAILLLRDWSRAHYVSQVLCRFQQRLERRLLNAQGSVSMDRQVDYSIACQAEVEATTAALKLQDSLPHIRARSLLGIVAKLEIIAGADRDIDDPTDFPWPHIASVLDDLKRMTGNLPSKRLERSVVHADSRRYNAVAAELVGLERQAVDHRLGRGSALGIEAVEKEAQL
ncbi:MAG: hypothetical protein E5Y06_31595 [Mesorhizobium sp.]|uniref:hypothetical protein n=1 Tax=Mesorhizobium sp. TaxID=1871066 RepID=UPI001208BF10|nr:hypothetical protein [Mesorhizobium sp.]TIN90669.1 MAG: hypothetical protein E5Y06_31595 [Mesorhizobium sp.]TJU93981.1 MAG: hypothetical protein E5Y08_31840 [Mesorhizobium sp.]